MDNFPRRKRAFDLLLCILALPVAVPVCLLAMAAIRLDSRGSPLFVQTRVGRGGRAFRLLKLRTMACDTGDLPSHAVNPNRITAIGRFIRMTKLDELPQLVNVMAGDMSFVGPRPCLPSQAELIAEWERHGLYALRPGITGPAQVAGIDMSDPALLARTEAAYYPDATFGSDLALIVRTFTGAGRGDAANKPRPTFTD